MQNSNVQTIIAFHLSMFVMAVEIVQQVLMKMCVMIHTDAFKCLSAKEHFLKCIHLANICDNIMNCPIR